MTTIPSDMPMPTPIPTPNPTPIPTPSVLPPSTPDEPPESVRLRSFIVAFTVVLVVCLAVLLTACFVRRSHRRRRAKAASCTTGTTRTTGATGGGEDRQALLQRLDRDAAPHSSYHLWASEHNKTTELTDSDGDFDMQVCAVCLGAFDDHTPVRGLMCMHVFHQDCLDKWCVDNSLTCPVCRQRILQNNFSRIIRPYLTPTSIPPHAVGGVIV